MKTEKEVRDMIASFYTEIAAIQKQPAYNTAAREAIESLTQKYMKGIAALEWVLQPSELPCVAVNHHDALVAALESAKRQLERYEEELTGEVYNDPDLNALLAAAKGETDASN